LGRLDGPPSEGDLKKSQPVLLRKLRPGDRRALALVYQAAFSGPGGETWNEKAADARIVQVLKSRGPAWVACLYGQPIGFAFLSLRQGHKGPYGELTELAVHPFFQNQGVGGRLLRLVKESRKKLKLKVIYGLVYRGTAEGFFKKGGFKSSRRSQVIALR
jgi:predicted N-acetyltransferase YhbS